MRSLFLLSLIFLPLQLIGQEKKIELSTEQQEVFSIIEELFNAYRDGDSTRIRSVFADNAILMRATYKGGKSVASGGSVDTFVNYVGSGLKQLHDELLWDYTVSVDDNLANVWTKYAFFLGGKFHHCGSEAFTLYKSETGWKILFLADNNLTENCDVPDWVMEKGTTR